MGCQGFHRSPLYGRSDPGSSRNEARVASLVIDSNPDARIFPAGPPPHCGCQHIARSSVLSRTVAESMTRLATRASFREEPGSDRPYRGER